MTNYNERLGEVLSGLSGKSFDAAFNNPDDYMVVLLRSEADAKQAITSLIKELVVEAKPARAVISDDEMGIDRARKSAANHAIDQFEQNLLKALEEV